MLIMAKTKKRVLCADEVEPSEQSPEDLDALIKEARGEEEREDTPDGTNDVEVSSGQLSLWQDFNDFYSLGSIIGYFFPCILQEEVLTHEEEAIKAYLSYGEPLQPQILENVIEQFWKQEPYM